MSMQLVHQCMIGSHCTWLDHTVHDWITLHMIGSQYTRLDHTTHDWITLHMIGSYYTWLDHTTHDWITLHMIESHYTCSPIPGPTGQLTSRWLLNRFRHSRFGRLAISAGKSDINVQHCQYNNNNKHCKYVGTHYMYIHTVTDHLITCYGLAQAL